MQTINEVIQIKQHVQDKNELSLQTIFEKYNLETREVNYIMALVHLDELTGWYNRRRYNEDVERMSIKSQVTETPLTAILFDIDHFKDFNDTYGHAEGDQVLKDVTETVRQSVRGYDCANLYRYGGEEFVMLFDVPEHEAYKIAERARSNLETTLINDKYKVTASFGICERVGKMDAGQMFLNADQALYSAKDNGRNRVEVYKQ